MRTCHQPENIHGDDVLQTYIRLWIRMCVLTKYDIIGFNPPSHHCQTGSISPFLAKYESTTRSIQFADPVYIKITLAILNTVCMYIYMGVDQNKGIWCSFNHRSTANQSPNSLTLLEI